MQQVACARSPPACEHAGARAQARETITTEGGRLCATPFGVDVVGITEVVALTGALVGGARPRHVGAGEGDQLRQKANPAPALPHWSAVRAPHAYQTDMRSCAVV